MILVPRPLVWVALIAAAGVYAPACARQQPASSSSRPTLRIGIGEAPKGMPNTGSQQLIAQLKGDTWFNNRPDGRVVERLISTWHWEEHGTVLRLRLRPNVFFHDGTPLTAQAAADSLRATDTQNDNFHLKSITSIRAEGSDTLVLTLKEHNDFLLGELGSISVLKAGAPSIGTGPYQLVSRDHQDARLVAFQRYYRGRPELSGVAVVNYPTQRNAWSALMRGDIDMLYEVSRDSSDFVSSESTVHTYPFARPYYIPLVFNLRHKILQNVDVRRAINEALDRQLLVRDGLRGQGTLADGPVSPLHWAYTPLQHAFSFDPASARALLDRAGYPLRPSPERGVPIRFAFTCLIFGNDSRFERLAMIAQKELADVGIDMQLKPLPLDELVPKIRTGDFDAFLFEMAGPRLSRVYDFWRSSDKAMMNSGYRATDAVLDRLRSAQTEDETKAGVAELMRIMHDDPPAAFIAWQRGLRAVSTRFDVAAEPDRDRDILTSLWMWRPANAPEQAAVR